MKKLKVAIIGAGNISNTRHIPALKKISNVIIDGVIGTSEKNVIDTIKKYKINNRLVLDKNKSYLDSMSECEWFKNIDAVIIGTPPKEHFLLAQAALKLKKHVLVEKPMTMDIDEADILIKLSEENKRRFCVMHNFQYASGMLKLEKLIKNGKLGNIVSFDEYQYTNKNRRLPEWYNELPLGLFFDEAAHFIYLLEKLGGEIIVDNVFANYDKDPDVNTPILLNASMRTGKYPVHLFVNFNSPICEWYFIIVGDKKIAIYDLFKDILIILPTDNEHYAMDVFKTSVRFTVQHWIGFIKNGFKMLTGNLLYGHDKVIYNFLNSIDDYSNIDVNIDCTQGYKTVKYMNNIIEIVNKRG